MGLPQWDSWGPDMRFPAEPAPRTLHSEIERIGKRVYTIKLFYRHGGMRDKVFLRHTIDGNWEEAKRQAAVLLELQGLKDG